MWHTLLPDAVQVVCASGAMWDAPPHPAEAPLVAHAVTSRRREFQAGRAAARAALRRFADAEDFGAILAGPRREPCWPPGFVGSIAHKGTVCGAAVARQASVLAIGIDVEHATPLDPQVLHSVCCDSELAELAREPLAGKIVFCAKEAFYKAYYPATQRFLDFSDVLVTLDIAQGTFSAVLVDPALPALHGLRSLDGRYAMGAGYLFTAIALAAFATRRNRAEDFRDMRDRDGH